MSRSGKWNEKRKYSGATRQLHSESLEDRHLLAADLTGGNLPLDYTSVHVTEPFAFQAVTVEQMVERAKVVPYVQGELVVALEIAGSAARAENVLASTDWSSRFGIKADLGESLMNFEREPGNSFVLVQLEIEGSVIEAMRQIDGTPGVLWTAPNFAFEGENAQELIPDDPQFSSQYHHTVMNNQVAWDTTLGDSSIIIGVTDDGVQLSHPDLASNIWTNTGEIAGNGVDDDGNGFIDDVNGFDFITNTGDPNSQSSTQRHGTHVAGIAAADTNNGVGVAGTAGNATIMPLQWYDSSNPGAWTSTVINRTYRYAADNGAHIVTTSYNVNGWVGDPTFTAGLQYMYDSGVLHFNSAGNGAEADPARTVFEQTLFVASTDSFDRKSSFSNWGTGVDIAAPGSDILSTVTNSSYDTLSGTSMSTPNVAGVAALIWSAHPDWTREMVAAQLLATADNIDALNPSYAGLLGAGRVNSGQALTTTIGAPQVATLNGLPANGSSVSPSTVIDSVAIEFSQLMDTGSVNSLSNYELRATGVDGLFDTADDVLYGLSLPSVYQVSTNDFVVDIDSTIGIGAYRFSILSDGLANPFGTPLDGNSDGTGGDDYAHYFSIGLEGFERIDPLGSLVSASFDNPGRSSVPGEVAAFDFFAEAGELVGIVATPESSGAALTLAIPGLSASVTGAPGETVILSPSIVTTTGSQVLEISSDIAANFRFDVYRNVDVDSLVESNEVNAIDASFIDLGSGRFAAFAQGDGSRGGFEFDLHDSPSSFIDISSTGTSISLSDDGEANVTSTVGNGLFPAGPITIANNGGVLSGHGQNLDYRNGALPSNEFDKGLFPFWDDIDAQSGNVYWEERIVDGINTLIVQWHDRPHYSNVGAATFQVQLFDSGPLLARFAYEDVDFGKSDYNNGASATVGVQTSSTEAFQYSLDSTVLFDGAVLDVLEVNPTEDVDRFSVDLSSFVGESVDIVIASAQGIFDNPEINLYDASGTNVASSGLGLDAGATNYEAGLLDYHVTSGGVYEIAVSTHRRTPYSIVVTESLAFDTESSDGLRSLDGFRGALGGIAADSDVYEITLAAGEEITLATQTPFDDIGRFPLNSLDPAIAVSDDSGTLAQDDNSGTDGKNASLTFSAPAAGTYRVTVSGTGVGEYVLNLDGEMTVPSGDFNNDGEWDCLDIDALVNAIASGSTALGIYDLNSDGAITIADRDAWLVEAGGINLGSGLTYLLGDADLDGFVDGEDFLIWSEHRFQASAAWCRGDFTANGVIDGEDFFVWIGNRFKSSFPPPAVARVTPVELVVASTKDDSLTPSSTALWSTDPAPRSIAVGRVSAGNTFVPAARPVSERLHRSSVANRVRVYATDLVFAENGALDQNLALN